MDRASGHGHRRFLHGFGQCRVGVGGAGEVFGGAAKFHQHGDLVDEFASLWPHNMGAQNFVGLGIGEDLHKAIGGLVGLGAAIGDEEELAGLVVHASSLEFVLGLADGGEFGAEV